MKRYFILGTDTDCGKTYVTCQLVRYLQNNQHSTVAIKPVASGCIMQEGALISEDELQLMRCNGEFKREVGHWRLKQPISPHLAAEADGQKITVESVIDFCAPSHFSEYEFLLIEGAGGLLVPLNDHETWVDFLVRSQIPVILVVGMRLGCINQALLTVLALQSNHITCAGWIANGIDKDMLALDANIQTLRRRIECPLLATLSHAGSITDKGLLELL